jgi:hypothetical protein
MCRIYWCSEWLWNFETISYSMTLDVTFSTVCCVPAVAADVHNKWRGTDNIYFAVCKVKLCSVRCSKLTDWRAKRMRKFVRLSGQFSEQRTKCLRGALKAPLSLPSPVTNLYFVPFEIPLRTHGAASKCCIISYKMKENTNESCSVMKWTVSDKYRKVCYSGI